MIIKPRVRGFFCTTAHPEGCAAQVQKQIDFAKQHPFSGAKKVLVIGASTGYGLASRITSAFSNDADTLGVYFEKEPSERKTGTAGWYNSQSFEKRAHASGLYAKSINGDAFSQEIKDTCIEQIKADLGQVDLVIYSLAAPRKRLPNGDIVTSVLKPIGRSYETKTLNTDKKEITQVNIEQATSEEIEATVHVMGGDDWQDWMTQLQNAGVLSDGCKTTAYTYIGEEITWPIYGKATIGRAKEDLDRAASEIRAQMNSIKGDARVSVLKAVVTQSSSAIPIMPLYISLLFPVMRKLGTHENPIQQIRRLFQEHLFQANPQYDDALRLRVDDLEMQPDVQQAVTQLWQDVTTDQIDNLTDFTGYRKEFLQLFGFETNSVNYDTDIDPRHIG
jgi:enoyl-[acyl-carrier protein] reductase/trans-2-enoyl-CoA reductase (NAD+)